MKTFAQIEVDSRMAVADVRKAKEAVKSIKKAVDGDNSALECMEQDIHYVYQVTAIKAKSGNIELFKRPCSMVCTTPLNIKVDIYYGKTRLKVSWLAEGVIDNTCCIAKIIAYATWENGWYMWDDCADNGTPNSPCAQVYISEADI